MTSFRRHALGFALLPLLLAAAPLRAQNPPAENEAPAVVRPTPEEAAPEPAPAPAPSAESASPPAQSAVEPVAPVAPPDAAPAAPPPAQPVVAEPVAPAAPPAPKPMDPKDVKLIIASRGGAYLKSQELAYFEPFARRSGYAVSATTFDGSLGALVAQGSPGWDVVDLDQREVMLACEQGLLEPLDPSVVQRGPDGSAPAEDFLPGGIQPCSVANVAWSAAIVYDKNLKTAPTKAENFFDLKRYPGKRALPRTPEHTLELALLGDGVAPAQVYALLATKEGQDRAFAKLTTIKSQIVWWDKSHDGLDKIAQKQAAMGLGFNGRTFIAMIKGRQPLAILWDHQIYHLSYWAVPKGARFAGPAREFIGFATGTGPMSEQTRWLPYGPARLSAVRLVGKHGEINLDMKPFLPTYQPNLQGALAFDGTWWATQGAALKDRFAAWLEGREPSGIEPPTSQ